MTHRLQKLPRGRGISKKDKFLINATEPQSCRVGNKKCCVCATTIAYISPHSSERNGDFKLQMPACHAVSQYLFARYFVKYIIANISAIVRSSVADPLRRFLSPCSIWGSYWTQMIWPGSHPPMGEAQPESARRLKAAMTMAAMRMAILQSRLCCGSRNGEAKDGYERGGLLGDKDGERGHVRRLAMRVWPGADKSRAFQSRFRLR